MESTTHHPFVALACKAIQTYVIERRRLDPPRPLAPEMAEPRGVFVSLHRGKELRGCIGTISPQRATLAEEIIENAISAATRDPRFQPVEPEELESLDLSVDVLTPPERIESVDDQDPKQHGLIVQSRREGWRRGLLLPDLEGIDTAEKQLYYTRVLKAGITDPSEPVDLFRFSVQRYY